MRLALGSKCTALENVLTCGQGVHAKDGLVAFGSIASLLGSAGQVNYAAANSYLETHAGELVYKARSCPLLT